MTPDYEAIVQGGGVLAFALAVLFQIRHNHKETIDELRGLIAEVRAMRDDVNPRVRTPPTGVPIPPRRPLPRRRTPPAGVRVPADDEPDDGG